MRSALCEPSGNWRATISGRWALTGGLAVEIHRLRLGCDPSPRALNDIDFFAGCVPLHPESLTEDFLFRHIHPLDPPGKTMAQLADPHSAVRVDVFRAYGAAMSRTSRLRIAGSAGPARFPRRPGREIGAVGARCCRQRAPVPSKHARDFLRLVELGAPAAVEAAWRDHRKPGASRNIR